MTPGMPDKINLIHAARRLRGSPGASSLIDIAAPISQVIHVCNF